MKQVHNSTSQKHLKPKCAMSENLKITPHCDDVYAEALGAEDKAAMGSSSLPLGADAFGAGGCIHGGADQAGALHWLL